MRRFDWSSIGWDDEDRRDEAIDRLLERMAKRRDPTQLPLTDQQLRIITGLSHGLGYKGTADLLGLTPATVQTHVKRAMRKAQAKDSTHLVARALRAGLID